jgi:recombination DNA repair RAD52 pathway protein
MSHEDSYENIPSEEYWKKLDIRDEEMTKRRKVEEERILAELNEPFPPEMERELRKGGTTLVYIPVSEVIARLNRIFGIHGWSSEIMKCDRDALDPDFIVAHVRLTIGDDSFRRIQKDGFGGQKIKRTKAGDIVDLGDEFKGAVSDALKKAAQQIGIGLYLARSDEALSLEVERDHAMNNPVIEVDPKVASLWSQFIELSKQFDSTQKEELSRFWKEFSNGQPKPTRETVTIHGAMALIEQSTKILFPGSEIIHDNGE